jgi:HEAT repeat protein
VRPPDEVAAAIVPLLAHADQGVRWAAALALRFVQTPNVIAALQRARTNEKDARVRAMIDESLVPRPAGAPADRARLEARDARISK